ncbi:cell division protein ZapE [Nocardia cyriacigeorgica]|uniref:cell division protein ZapE n=1 Tax=Nocardia cyriacigeorgica TaxID=135487 RepID=UPI001E3B1AA7|nr:cell division protein ZapE [Nocardia cyriacigeorgica]
METIRWDADQERAAAALGRLLDRHHRPRKHHRGVYLHGRPGRGKTMVMDRFFASVGSKRKRRFHFHTFFASLHAENHARGSIDKAIDTLLGNAQLVCFDEFHVHDIGDAMLIARMLDALFARRLTLVVTSNYAPAELLPNPLFHDHFLPTIERIVAELDVVSLDGPLDYRTVAHGRATGFRAGRYIVGPPPRTEPGSGRISGPASSAPGDGALRRFGRMPDPAVPVDSWPGRVGRTRDPAVPVDGRPGQVGHPPDPVVSVDGGPGRVGRTPDPVVSVDGGPGRVDRTPDPVVPVDGRPGHVGHPPDPVVSVDGGPGQVGRMPGPAVPSRASARIEPGVANAPGRVSADGNRADAAAVHDSPGSTGPRVEVAVGSRTVRALAVDATTITLDFADLCAVPTSAADYVDLAERFHTWNLYGVPLLREVPPDWAMRLVNLVDVLYDADRTLTVYAQAPVAELVDGVRGVPDIARAASRLGELSQTEAVAVS